jgi:predicted amidohydrolase YtcJ
MRSARWFNTNSRRLCRMGAPAGVVAGVLVVGGIGGSGEALGATGKGESAVAQAGDGKRPLSARGGARRLRPDLILLNGVVLTMDERHPRARAIAIRDDRITAVGTNRAVARLAGRNTRRVNLRGRTVIPGLIDGHTHAIRGGQTYDRETYWLGVDSLEHGLRMLTEAASERRPDEWVGVVGSWHPNQFSERRAPTVADLTQASPTNPAYVQFQYDYGLVNEAGIRALRLNESTTPPVPNLTVERDANGQATGRLFGNIGSFNALTASILLPQSFAARRASLKHYFTALNAAGVTGLIDDAAGAPAAYEPLFSLARRGRLSLRAGYRIPAQAPGNESAFFESVMAFRPPVQPEGLTPFLGIGETLVFGANDAVRQSPGYQVTPQARAELQELATFAASRRIPLEIHAYTDDLASQVLDVFEQVNGTYPIRGLRWALAHLNTGSARTIARMKALGLAYSVQMGALFEAPAILETNSPEVAGRSAARMAIDRGLVVAGGTDATRVGDYRVWPGLEFHVTGASLGDAVVRPPSQRLTRLEALRAYTLGSAWLAFDNDDRGSLKPGKLADLAVLDKPYLRVPAKRIGEIRSLLTLVNGKAVYDRRGWLND